jgi:hypothetical protein
MLPASNDEELMLMIGNDLQKVIEQLADWILGQITMSLMDNVYSFPEGNTYQRLEMDGGVLGSFTKQITDFTGNYVEAKVFSDPNLMVYDPEKHVHGNLAEDRRPEILQDIETGTNYDFGGNSEIPREFWSIIENMVSDGTLDSVFEGIMLQHGISLQ